MLGRFIALVASLFLVGCASSGRAHTESELEAARERWDQESSGTYTFTWQQICFCAYSTRPLRVTVSGGAITSARQVDDQVAVDPAQYDVLTIEGVFDKIEKEIDRADEVEVTYDPVTGVPRIVAIDLYAGAIDDETEIRISDVVPGVR